MRAAKTPKKIFKMPYPPQKKLFRRKWNSITPAKGNCSISQTFSESLKLTIQTYPMRKKELKMNLGQLQEKNIKSILAS